MAQFLCAKKRVILGAEQGTGKTIVSLAAAEKLKELGYINNVLIICPSAITWQWIDRIEEFTDGSWTNVSSKTRHKRNYETDAFYTVTSFAIFRQDVSKISACDWDLIIADEAQELKNNRSRTSRFFKRYLGKSTYRWALTGTAVSNKLEELYSIMYWVDKDFLPAWPAFEREHIIRNYFGGIEGYKNLELLSNNLQKRFIRKSQAEIGGLPKIIPQHYYFNKTKELVEAEKELLGALDKCAEKSLLRDPDVSRAFHAVRQASITGDKADFVVKYAEDLLDANNTNRLVVFSFYKEPLHELQALFGMRGISTTIFTGDENTKEKKKAVQAFKEETRIFLASNAGRAGLDLPHANYLIHLDVPFDHGTLDQRSKRIVRISSSFENCVVIYLLIKDSLDEFYYKVVLKKGDLATATYTGNKDKVIVKPETLRQYLHDKHRRKDKAVPRAKEN